MESNLPSLNYSLKWIKNHKIKGKKTTNRIIETGFGVYESESEPRE